MTRLRIKFTDDEGEEKWVTVDSPEFAIGRHSSNDLAIVDSRLSRDHALIERRGDDFFISDRGSSNGTSLNGVRLLQPSRLKNGDKADLGGGVELDFEIEEKAPAPDHTPQPSVVSTPNAAQPMVGESGDGFPIGTILIAPLLGFFILAIALGAIYISRGNSSAEVVEIDNREHRQRGNDDAGNDLPSPSATRVSPSPSTTSTTASPIPSATQAVTGDDSKIEKNAAAFLRRAAQNDQRAFITTEQAKLVESAVKQLSGSPAIADNLKAARRGTADITSLAASKGLKPQFLVAAALAKLGTTRGDVVQTARSMVETLGRLNTQIGTDISEDALLLIAAYDQGESGDFSRMINMVQKEVIKYPESAREVRTIWFLHKNGKITDAEFGMALRFLAIGTISQNPADFGVNAEALVL